MRQAQLSDISRGRFTTVRLDTAQRLTKFFGCAVEDLFPTTEREAVSA